jgi:L,D-peptidoglycan transpeptidase YkuD (ErfK/YbiS/YcfS/YnhG family)
LPVLAVAVGILALALVSDAVLPRSVAPVAGTAAAIVDPVPMFVEDPGPPSPTASPSPSPSPSPSTSPTPKASTSARPVAARPAPPPKPDNLASRLHTLPAATRQVIVAHAAGYGTSIGTLETFQKVNGAWQPVFGRLAARLGTKGFSDRKVEGDLTTPTGVYRIGGTMYGIAGNPGLRYGYHQLVADDYWNENTTSPGYNSFVHGTDPGGGSEKLWQVSPQYTYFAVIDYNIPVVAASPARGSGIFLHVSAGRGTAGCLALDQPDLVKVLKWLDPGAAPRIVMAPDAVLGRY